MITQPGKKITWGEAHVGARQVFADAGFQEVSHPAPSGEWSCGSTSDRGGRQMAATRPACLPSAYPQRAVAQFHDAVSIGLFDRPTSPREGYQGMSAHRHPVG